jgi:HEAT repeats
MKKRCLRVSVGLFSGLAILIAGVWGLSKALATPDSSYQGKPREYWILQLSSPDAGASNAASTVLDNEIIPHLTNVMFHDTHDPAWKLRLVDALDGLPGITVNFEPADVRRKAATYELGEYGPAARKAVPALLQALIGEDGAVRETAARSLGSIGADPQEVIPVLTQYLIDDNVNSKAATALAGFGPAAKSAVPGLVRMLQTGDGESQFSAREALKRIDPDAYAAAMHPAPKATN